MRPRARCRWCSSSPTPAACGSAASPSVELHLGVAREVLAVPETALLRDAGRWVAYVQLEGEAFERRLIEPGERAGGWVEIVGGLAAGDRVVTAGAYQVKLAAAGGAVPGHGHAH
jgi:cobalt-zinc-cadmium efflux system membrane fusion protein